ncbi:MAG: rhomboid family intramembrane serine protease [Phycisphaerae bacterium]|nr:rhomboid family intramembrane serine protease [Phycisphaerae bacterium]
MIPIGTDYRMRIRPWVNYALVAANVALYLLGYNGAGANAFPDINALMLHPQAPRLEQFFSSMFMHAGLAHLLGNMVFLWVFGNALNDRLGHAAYLGFYLAGGILAGIGYVLLSGRAPVLGASGAISAVTGAYLVLFPRVRVTVLMILVYVLMPIELSSLVFLAFQFVWNLFYSFAGAGGNVAYIAHSSGYVFGIAVAAGLLAARLLPRDGFDLLSLVSGGRRRAKFRRMVNRGYDPFGAGVATGGPHTRRVRSRSAPRDRSDTPSQREQQLRRDIVDARNRHDLPAAAELYLQLVQISDKAVLPRAAQLDVANQLMAGERYPAAADAYERFQQHYPRYEHMGDIDLMLGIIYGRYLHDDERAEQKLRRAVETLDDDRKRRLAASDLDAVRERRRG